MVQTRLTPYKVQFMFHSILYLNWWENHPVCEIGATTNTWTHRHIKKYQSPSNLYENQCLTHVQTHSLETETLHSLIWCFEETSDPPLAFQLERVVLDELRSNQIKEPISEWFEISHSYIRNIICWYLQVADLTRSPQYRSTSVQHLRRTHRQKGTRMPCPAPAFAPIKLHDWHRIKLAQSNSVLCESYNHVNQNGTETPHWRWTTDSGEYLYHCSQKKGHLWRTNVDNYLSQLVQS